MPRIEDVKNWEGQFSHKFVVDEHVKKSFQECSDDFNPLHNDEEFAKRKGFKECVMYGNILNCFLSYFIGEMLPSQEVIIHSQDIVYREPVYKGDILDFTAKVSEIIEAYNAIQFKYTFKNEAGKTVAKGHIQIGLINDAQ